MSKRICDVCGTSYPDTAECCPICGCTPDAANAFMEEDLLEQTENQDIQESTARRKEIFDFDEVNGENPEAEEAYAETDYDDEEEDEEPQGQNTLVVIALTVLIALLLMAAGFIFVKFFLPNMGHKRTETAVAEQTMATAEESTDLSIPCQELYIISGKTVELSEAGQMFLLHVKASPENTTDKIIYTSADESIATVTEDGKITAVSEGETVISISCGVSTMECPVIVKYVQETVPPTTAAAETVPAEGSDADAATQETATQETAPAEQPQQETTPAASAPASQELKNVVLKLKKTDIRLGVYYEFKLLLDCDLEQNEVQWSSEHPYIASVDENGVVRAIKSGTTSITAQYGEQKVTCMVRCY